MIPGFQHGMSPLVSHIYELGLVEAESRGARNLVVLIPC